MAVFSLPEEFENQVPVYIFGASYPEHKQAEEAFLARLVSWAKERNPADEHAGAIVRWPVADGYAQYLVAATKPVQLVHLPLGDGYSFPLDHRATKKDIVALIDSDKAWAALVAENKARRAASSQ